MYHLEAQKDIVTASGQKITIHLDGTWVNTDNTIPFEKPYPTFLSQDQITTIKTMSDVAKTAEIKYFLEIDSLMKLKDGVNMQISQAKKLNNNDSRKYYEALLKNTESKIPIYQKKYEESSKVINRISQLKSLDEKNLFRELATLSSELQIQVPKNVNPTQASAPSDVKKDEQQFTGNFSTSKTECCTSLDTIIRKSRILELKNVHLSNYTPEKLKTYFKEKELLTSYVAMSSIGNQKKITFTHKLISKDAAKFYGSIPQAALGRITLITGKNIDLYSMDDSYPTIESYTGHMVYTAEYIVNKSDFELLSKTPIDTFGCMWSSGFETYTIYEVDVLIRLADCLQKLLK